MSLMDMLREEQDKAQKRAIDLRRLMSLSLYDFKPQVDEGDGFNPYDWATPKLYKNKKGGYTIVWFATGDVFLSTTDVTQRELDIALIKANEGQLARCNARHTGHRFGNWDLNKEFAKMYLNVINNDFDIYLIAAKHYQKTFNEVINEWDEFTEKVRNEDEAG